MAEDQGKKEDKFDFTSEGETLGYIGMDQAQVRAMQVATETPGDYGSAYSGIRMAFEVVNAQETEDHYIITLSLRPQGDFAGRFGQEQFFIEKEGGVAHRQVLALPSRGRRFPVVLVAIGLAVVAAIAVGAVFAVAGRDGGGEDTSSAAVLPTDTPVPATIMPVKLPNTGSTPIPTRVPITAEDVRRIREEAGGSTPNPATQTPPPAPTEAAAVVPPNVTESIEYLVDLVTIQTAVDSYFTAADNVRYLDLRQFPIMGASSSGNLMEWGDAATRLALPAALGNPLRGTSGGDPDWVDDGDLVREATEEGLIRVASSTDGGWRVTKVNFQGVDYAVDTRDYFIDFDLLVDAGLLRSVPQSASPDNGGGTDEGSYSWYISATGLVIASYYDFPVARVAP